MTAKKAWHVADSFSFSKSLHVVKLDKVKILPIDLSDQYSTGQAGLSISEFLLGLIGCPEKISFSFSCGEFAVGKYCDRIGRTLGLLFW